MPGPSGSSGPSGPSTPTQFAGLPSGQQSRLQGLREVLRRANVPDATADQIVQQQAQLSEFRGYVTRVVTFSDGVTGVSLTQSIDPTGIYRNPEIQPHTFIRFPPNDAKYLPELLRAMNHKFAVLAMVATPSPGSDPIINSIEVATDMAYLQG